MVEVPMDYSIAWRFIDALKPEISEEVISRGHNPKNSKFDTLVTAALHIEEAMLYKARDDRLRSKPSSASNKPTSTKGGSKTTFGSKSYAKPTARGTSTGTSTAGNKQPKCFSCKKKGHYSTSCPNKGSRPGRSANVEASEDEGASASTSEPLDQTDSEEYTSAAEPNIKEPGPKVNSANTEDGTGLVLTDWCATACPLPAYEEMGRYYEGIERSPPEPDGYHTVGFHAAMFLIPDDGDNLH